jgi:hypothetical protein
MVLPPASRVNWSQMEPEVGGERKGQKTAALKFTGAAKPGNPRFVFAVSIGSHPSKESPKSGFSHTETVAPRVCPHTPSFSSD